MAAVEKILIDLDLQRTPLQRVFNKVDKIDRETANRLCHALGGIGVSALDPETFSPLLQAMQERLFRPQVSLSPPSPEAVALSI
jgi:GTP-binding protein HflX